MKKPLRFPAPPKAEQDEPKARTYSEQQQVVSRMWRIYDDCGAPRPDAALIVRLWRRLFNGDSDAMAAALDDCADRGQLNVAVPYGIAVLRARLERGEFAPAPREEARAIGTLDRSGMYRWDGEDWEPLPGTVPN